MPVLTCPTMPASSATGPTAKEPVVKDLIRQERCDLRVPVGHRCPPVKSLIRRYWGVRRRSTEIDEGLCGCCTCCCTHRVTQHGDVVEFRFNV